jgi:transposase
VARGYRPVERDQQFLLPPDMREWLPAGHPVWLLISVVSEHLDTSAFHAGRKLGGAGRAGYDPDMLLTLLIWAWSQGVRSSRRIERLCQQDVAFRVICAGDVPDHVTIHRFRAEFSNAVAALFAQVLMLCARLGLGQLGTIALDGTKIAANASKAANRDLEGLRRLAEQTEQAVQTAQAAAAEHAAADAAEDALFGRDGQGDTLPDDPNGPNGPNGPGGRRWSRSERIAAALAGMAAEQAAAEQAAAEQRQRAAEEHLGGREQGMAPVGRVPDEVAVEVAEVELARAISAQQAKLAAQQQRRANAAARGQKLPERPVVAVEDHYLVRRARQRLSAAHARRAGTAGSTGSGEAGSPRPVRNLTDPDSRLQPVRGGGWLQGYNCQAVTSADLLILATAVGTNPADVTYFQPMMTAAVAAADLIARHRSPQHPPAADTRDGDTRDDDTRDDDRRRDRDPARRRRLSVSGQPHRHRPGPTHRRGQGPRCRSRRPHQARPGPDPRRRRRHRRDEPPATHPRRHRPLPPTQPPGRDPVRARQAQPRIHPLPRPWPDRRDRRVDLPRHRAQPVQGNQQRAPPHPGHLIKVQAASPAARTAKRHPQASQRPQRFRNGPPPGCVKVAFLQ